MKPLEDELRSLLKREEPAEGFAGRVLERVRTRTGSDRRPVRSTRLGLRWFPAWAATGVMVCALLGAGAYVGYRAGEMRTGELAKAQAIQALRIASNELNVAFERALVNGPSSTGPRHASPRD